MINYTNSLREHNLKATPQRLAITDILYKEGHINIEKLYEVMIKKFNSISLATIYKNINLMIENSFIQEVKIPNSKSVYELTKGEHSHLVCKNCHEVTDIEIELNSIIHKTSDIYDFDIQTTNLVLSGLCKKCK